MPFKKFFKNKARDPEAATSENFSFGQWLDIFGIEKKLNVENEATYYTCLKILSETIGKMPLKVYQHTEKGNKKIFDHPLYKILNIRPNPYMTPSVFWATVEMCRNHYGNAYIYFSSKGNTIQNLWILDPEYTKIVVDDNGYIGKKNGIYYKYTDKKTQKQYYFQSSEILHFKTSSTFDGIVGIPVREVLEHNILGSLEAQNYMNNLYKKGMTAKSVLQYTGDLDQSAKRRLLKGLEEFTSGSSNGGIIPIPLGMQIQPLDIKLTDSQFFELKKYSSLQIAAAFGIKPNHLNNYDKSSYSNSETQQLSFYVDTMQYILKAYEEELIYKLLNDVEIKSGLYLKYNESVILRTDKETQMKTLTSGINNAVYTPNEAREILDMPAKEGGDVLMTNGNYIPVHQVGSQYNNNTNNNNNNEGGAEIEE